MVVVYRDRFIKFFTATLILIFLTVLMVSWITTTVGDLNNVTPEKLNLISFLGKFLVPVVVITEVFYFYIHYLLAKAKGYSGWLALLGLIQTFGLLILFLLPDKRPNG